MTSLIEKRTFLTNFIKGVKGNDLKMTIFVNFDLINSANQRNNLTYHVGNFLKNMKKKNFCQKMDF